MLCSVLILVCPSLSLIVIHTRTQTPLVSPGKISTVSAKNGGEQMASEWLKPPTMVPTTSLSLSLSLTRRPLSPSLPARSRVLAQLHPSLFNASLTALAKEAQAQWKPHGTTQSQPRGEREAGERERRRSVEGRRTQGFDCFISPTVWDFSPPPVLFSAPLFLDRCTACNNLKSRNSRNVRSHARDLLLLKQLK